MEHYQDLMDHIIMEDEYKCTECLQYTEHFITGCYETGVKYDGHWFTWAWAYNSPCDEIKTIKNNIEKAILKAQGEL